MNSTIDTVLSKLRNVRPSGPNNWEAQCPAHDDRRSSLSVGISEFSGNILLHCHAGCHTKDICQAINIPIKSLFPNDKPLLIEKPAATPAAKPAAPKPAPPAFQGRKIVQTYDYIDGDKLAYQVVRYEPKDFRQRRPDGKGGWIWNLTDVQRILYRLPELKKTDPEEPVFIVEGEKDADNLINLGLVATTSPQGAGKWDKVDDTPLHNRTVILLADNDDIGRKHVSDIAKALEGKAREVRTLELPNLPPKGDISDYLETKDTLDPDELKQHLKDLANKATKYNKDTPDPTEPGPVIKCLADIEPKKISWLWPGRIPLGRLALLVGRPGEGKSFLTTDMAARVTTGTPWPDGSPCPQGSVIMISAEDDPADTIRPRLDAHYANCKKIQLLSAVRRNVDGKPKEVMFTLKEVDDLEKTLKIHNDCKLVIIDPIGSFIGGNTDAHRDNEVRSVLAPIAMMAEKYATAVLVVAHRRKSTSGSADDLAMGSRAFTGIARAVWHLSRDKENKNRRLFLPGKNNLAPEGDGLAFTIGGDPAVISWEKDAVNLTADEGLEKENSVEKEGDRQSPAEAWLKEQLGDMEEHSSRILIEEGKEMGWSKTTLYRVADNLKVIRRTSEYNKKEKLWRLPKKGRKTEDSHEDSHDT